jgi:S1-C subfamily serine protease
VCTPQSPPVHLKKGKNFDRADAHDLSGLHVLRKNGQAVINSVDKGSTAETAGLKPGDVLVRVGDAKPDEVSLFQRRNCFCAEDTKLRLTVRRDDKEVEIVLALGREPVGGK